MKLKCKLFGHEPRLLSQNTLIVPTGWVQQWNTVYDYVEYAKVCDHCGHQYDFVIISHEKEKSNGCQ